MDKKRNKVAEVVRKLRDPASNDPERLALNAQKTMDARW